MNTILVLSPHLDDAAFSCGGLLAQFADAGMRVVVATVFTRSVPHPTGFALACQTDKGLGADVDYMALRREEDRRAMAILGAEPRWLDLPEAPHRGYHSAAALFAGPVAPEDTIVDAVADTFRLLQRDLRPDAVLIPSGIGQHIDHRQVISAARRTIPDMAQVYYRDAPYVIRNPSAPPAATLSGFERTITEVSVGLDRKIAASAAYSSQLGFQFGGAGALEIALRAFAWAEGGGRYPAEVYYAQPGQGLEDETLQDRLSRPP